MKSIIKGLLHKLQGKDNSVEDMKMLFDENYYNSQISEHKPLQVDGLAHYLDEGWIKGNNPSPVFDSSYYLSNLKNSKSVNLNPLLHFSKIGWKEGRNPHPLFDVSYYLSTYIDVKKARINPLVHFLNFGWKEGRNPHPLFNTSYYLRTYQDIKALKVNPLIHFLESGWKEGRKPHQMFDTMSYLALYNDVKESNKNPLIHYLEYGGFNNYNPIIYFDSNYYLQENDCARTSSLNPLVHYVLYGYKKAKKIHPIYFFDDLYKREHDLASDVIPLVHYIENNLQHPVFSKFNYMNTDQFKEVCEESGKKLGVVPNVPNHDMTMAYAIFHEDYFNRPEDAVKTYFSDGAKSAGLLAELVYKDLHFEKEKTIDLLEFASGYGRVTRHWQKYLNANITACDIHDQAVKFLAEVIGCKSVLSSTTPEDLTFPDKYDVIFCLSFFTHMPDKTWSRYLNELYKNLKFNGILIFTTHGKRCCEIRDITLPENGIYFTSETEQLDLSTDDYGYTIVSEDYVKGIVNGTAVS